jgi:hypothetical protein
MTAVTQALLHGKDCLPEALSLVLDIFPLLCVLFTQDVFFKTFHQHFSKTHTFANIFQRNAFDIYMSKGYYIIV